MFRAIFSALILTVLLAAGSVPAFAGGPEDPICNGRQCDPVPTLRIPDDVPEPPADPELPKGPEFPEPPKPRSV